MNRPGTILALALCCLLALTRVLGIHVHIPHDAHGHAAVTVGASDVHRDHDRSRVVSEFGHHEDTHLSHTEVDADTPDESSGKLPSPVLLAFAAAVIAALMTGRSRGFRRSSYNPPPPRRRSHVLPLSQAPPLAG